jgi:hypothetical protein
MLLLRERTTVLVEQATSALVRRRTARVPGRSGLNCGTRRGVVSARIGSFIESWMGRLAQSETDI